MKRIIRSLLVAGVLSFAGVQSSQAAIINGSFEDGFTGWETIGNNKIRTENFGSGPTDGNKQSLSLTSGDAVGQRKLESFLGLESRSLDWLGNGNATEGSAIKQTFTASAGDVISFDYNFLTNEDTPSSYYNDFAFVTLTGVGELADTNSSTVTSLTSFDEETGFATFTQTIEVSGTYTLGIGVVDSGDKKVKSGILVDNVKQVPEPLTIFSSFIVLGFGAVCVRQNNLKASKP